MKDESGQEKLSRENARLRGDLLTVARRISHDLRTPLGGVVAASEMLKEVLAENNPSRASLTAPIFDSTEEIKKLIERASFILKASVDPISKEPVKMDEVVFRALQRLESKILKKNAVVSEPASWPEVDGVFSWLEVMWWNLLANALRFGNGRIELGWQEENGELRFWICDNGAGVPMERRDELFQPFHTLHEPDAAHGLGLSIVQRLTELQGGRCGYEPRSEGGSRFYFTMPIQ
ncbi:MAG TPA: ATP-binding protein [Verrucomicrobiae bacterium]|jgi:signal transduction histidine kinase|nr:ATP-binding protein [Verrucomicrobiae bacterium]